MLASTALLAGCGPSEQDRVETIYALSASSSAAAQAEIVKQWNAKALTLDACINLAHDRLDERKAAALPFAAATLNATADLEAAAIKGGVNEFYWFRIGTLAGKAAVIALDAGDVPGARALVFAGPRRWQEENYWRFHPDHDAAASVIMHRNGETAAALARLRNRPDLNELGTDVLNKIEAEQAAKAAAKAKKK